MVTKYQISHLRFESGERFPLLSTRCDSRPLFLPTLYVLQQLRPLGRAFRTELSATRAVMIGLQLFEHLGIDFEERLDSGRLLDMGEIEGLVRLLWLGQDAIDRLPCPSTDGVATRSRVVSLERARMRRNAVNGQQQVGEVSMGSRLLYIRNYLRWRIQRKRLSLRSGDALLEQLSKTSETFLAALSQRIPTDWDRNVIGRRQGLGRNVMDRILRVVEPDSPENPWKNKHVRIRNQLIVHWLYYLGIRMAELLILQLRDINFQANEVFIPRRADDPLETRADAPNTKTKDRLLALDERLAEMTRQYVMGPRREISGAKRHPFLFIATGTGEPLSKAALGQIFIELRKRVPNLPETLSAHTLRHTWNDEFSELMDERKVTSTEEERLRKQHMGWSDQSRMAAVYTRRHIQREAKKASLAMQTKARTRFQAQTDSDL